MGNLQITDILFTSLRKNEIQDMMSNEAQINVIRLVTVEEILTYKRKFDISQRLRDPLHSLYVKIATNGSS